jgi:hypothetical protein
MRRSICCRLNAQGFAGVVELPSTKYVKSVVRPEHLVRRIEGNDGCDSRSIGVETKLPVRKAEFTGQFCSGILCDAYNHDEIVLFHELFDMCNEFLSHLKSRMIST